MQQTLQSGKRIFSAAVAAATIAFSVGLAGIVAPMTAHGASAGDLIKGSLSTVYYYGYDGMRYTFSNEKTYMTWYSNFSGVTTISDSSLADIDLGGNAVYRPGSRWIKIQSDPKVYAVAADGMIHWIESETVATNFAGSDWASYVEDVPDAFFVDYTVGASLMTADAYEGMMWVDGGTYYVNVDGESRTLSSAARTANNLQSRFFLDGSGIDTSALSAGAAITGEVTSLTDVAQSGIVDPDTTGDLDISLSSSTPNGATIPGLANSVEVLSFDVEAGAEDSTLNSVTLSMGGVGSTTNVTSVYLYEGVERLTEARSVNAATRQVTFGSLRLDVDAGDTRTFTVRIEAADATAADTIAFSIESADDVDASGDVGGNFPVEGETFTFTTQNVGEIDVTKSGTIDNATVGEQDAVIGMFRITANTEDASVRAITLTVEDAQDHDDYKLWNDSTLLASGEWVSGDLISFDLSDDAFAIEEGSSEVFSVSADVGGETADTIKVYIDNAVDVEAVGGDYGFGLAVDTDDASGYDGTSCTSASGKCSFNTLEGGDVTIVGNGPTAGDVQTDSQDVTLLNFTITSAEEITVKDLDIIVYGDDANNDPFDATDDAAGNADADNDGLVNTGTEANLKDIKIVNTDTGVVVMGPLELDALTDAAAADDADQTIDFTDDFMMEAGETLNLAVTVDIDNGVAADTEFGATFDISGLSLEDANGDAVSSSSIVPSGDIQGYAQTAKSASLLIALASTPGDVVTVDGTDDVLVNAFTFVAGTAGDIDVSSVKISVYADEDNSGTFTLGDVSGADVNDFIESCYLTNAAGTMLGSAKTPISTGISFTVTNMNWTVGAGDTETLKVYCSFANPSDGTDDNAFAFDIADLSEDVVSQDEDGNDVDATTDAPNGGTSPTNSVYVHDAGSLAATVSSNTPNADFILTSSSDVHVASYTFTATREDFEVQTISLSEEEGEDDACGFSGISATQFDWDLDGDATCNGLNSSQYSNNISLVTIAYENEDGEAVEKSAAMSGNQVKFTLAAGDYLYVPVGEPADVDVYVNVPLTDRDASGSATSNEEIRMALFVDTTNDDNFKAVGTGSGIVEDDDDESAIGDDRYVTDGVATFVVRETKPTFSISSASPSGAESPSLLEALRFNVAASSNRDVVLEQITFKVTTTDNASSDWNRCDLDADATRVDQSDFSFYEVTGGSLNQLDTADTDWTLWSSTGTLCTTTAADFSYVTLELPTSELVANGGTATYVLKMDASLASSSADDALRVDIVTEPSMSTWAVAGGSDAANMPTTLAVDATTINLDDESDIYMGDVLCLDADDDATTAVTIAGCDSVEEMLLVVSCTETAAVADGASGIGCTDAATVTVVRGYGNSLRTLDDGGTLDTSSTALAGTEEVLRLPGGLLWQDDGSVADGTTEQTRWGAWMVDYLDLNGGTLVF